MEEALVARLRADASIAALVATVNSRPAVDWMERPESLPAVTLQDVSAGRNYAHSGAVGLDNPMVQIDCWAESYGEAKVLARAVIAEMEGAATVSGIAFEHAFLAASRAMDPEDLGGGIKVFRQSLDFNVRFNPA
ncbi:MAG TPA: DUF3168 domain-containing protein [Erythrobacter sp.]|mgnify:CR=1 FL=1|nr:DUF3168 domain-containing protein [Erythrobacter sp.]